MVLFDPVEALAHERGFEAKFFREVGVEADGAAIKILYSDLEGKRKFHRRRNPPGVLPRFAQPAGARTPYGRSAESEVRNQSAGAWTKGTKRTKLDGGVVTGRILAILSLLSTLSGVRNERR